jgi:transcription antitermination factor NusG
LTECKTIISTLHNQINWFAVYTRTHHEKSVMQHLTDRRIEGFLPLYKAVHSWTNHRRVSLDLPLFPNYLFVHICPRERVRTLEVPGVVSLVGQGAVPAPLPEIEIESLRSAVLSRKLEPHPYLAAGTKARIVAGPLAGIQGVVLRTRSGGLRVIITIEMIMQSIAVEVAAEELDPDSFIVPAC